MKLFLRAALLAATIGALVACSSSDSKSNSGNQAMCPYPASAGDPLIDDLEDGDGFIARPRVGSWFVGNSGAPVAQSPTAAGLLPSDDGTGNLAMHTSGTGIAPIPGYFALIGAALRAKVGESSSAACAAYDASTFSGVGFRIKGSTTSGMITFLVPTVQTQTPEYNGTCTANCEDSYAVNVPVTADWTLTSIHWSDLFQAGFGQEVPFDRTSVLGVQWQVEAEQGPDFDFWIDDVSFLTN